MRATREELPIMLEAGPSSIRGADWGEMRVSLVSVPAGTDFSPLLRGLPEDRCQGPHWGYVLKGRMRVIYADREEVVEAGDAYYMAPGHTLFVEADVELVEFRIVPRGVV